ncbi:MAG: hypothetical protein IJY25_01220 [Bacilli bacterium]|nr:hypothetical protein [Bacilli bacterium]
MILVTLGTQDKKFYRLLKAVDKAIKDGYIKDEVIVQAGYSSDYKSKNLKIFDLIPMEEFDELLKKCNLLITHGGVGTITSGLKNNKVVIAVPRLAKYQEHINDHQLQIINQFSDSGYILALNNEKELPELLKQAKTFKPKKYSSNANKFRKLVEKEIEKVL